MKNTNTQKKQENHSCHRKKTHTPIGAVTLIEFLEGLAVGFALGAFFILNLIRLSMKKRDGDSNEKE